MLLGGLDLRLGGGVVFEADLESCVLPFDKESAAALGGRGLELLRHLARQLGGDVEQGTPERGTSITVRFPLVV